MNYKNTCLGKGYLWDQHTIFCSRRTNASKGCQIRPKIGCIECFEIFKGGTELQEETKWCYKCNLDIPVSHFYKDFEFCKSCSIQLSKMRSLS